MVARGARLRRGRRSARVRGAGIPPGRATRRRGPPGRNPSRAAADPRRPARRASARPTYGPGTYGEEVVSDAARIDQAWAMATDGVEEDARRGAAELPPEPRVIAEGQIDAFVAPIEAKDRRRIAQESWPLWPAVKDLALDGISLSTHAGSASVSNKWCRCAHAIRARGTRGILTPRAGFGRFAAGRSLLRRPGGLSTGVAHGRQHGAHRSRCHSGHGRLQRGCCRCGSMSPSRCWPGVLRCARRWRAACASWTPRSRRREEKP